MDLDRFARLQELFARARELSGDDREAYLREACGDDAELRDELDELLVEDTRITDDVVDRALTDDAGFAHALEGSRPERIGKYRVLSICGSGGMGTVYEAEQDGTLRRVALKVIQAGTMRPDLLHRFRREVEILARLQHPCIAQIYEAGEFEQDGGPRPYFAMEFVDGLPLMEFARRHALSVTSRLDVFLQICDAIHYAHQQGVVHRDLKPDNLFVQEATGTTTRGGSGVGRPKILDFGVAQLTDSELKRTMATGAGALLGSVYYMSPEQAAGEVAKIDARSDVYALGVVLFELLTGELPYRVKHRPLGDALHAILHDEPSRLGSADPGLRGDLDTIVGKCLEKDRGRRYQSAADLADDLRRYVELKPITARPPTTWYQLQKFAQRNRALVGGVVATFLAVLLGAIVAVVLAVEANESAREATESRERSDRQAYRANLAAASALFETDPAQARRILEETPEHRRGWEYRYLASALSGFLLEFGEVAPRTDGRHGNRTTGDMHLLANGERVVARSAPDEFRVWETRSGEVVRSFRAPEEVLLFSVARDGGLLAAVLASGAVVVADPREDAPDWDTWFESDTEVDAIAVAPDGGSIALDRPYELRFGKPGAWRVLEQGNSRDHYKPAELEYRSDGARLACLNGTVRRYDARSGERVEGDFESTQSPWTMAYSASGDRVAVGMMRREIRVYDPTTAKYDAELLGNNGIVVDLAYGASGRVVSVCRDGAIRVWDEESERQVAIFDAPGTTKAEFVDDEHVLSLTNGRFRLWNTSERRARRLEGHRGHVLVTVFSGDGGLVATSAPWEDLIVWDPIEASIVWRDEASLRFQFAFDRSGENLLRSHLAGDRYFNRFPWTGEEPSVEVLPGRGPYHAAVDEAFLRVDGATSPATHGALTVYRTEHPTSADAGPTRTFLDGAPVELDGPGTPAVLGERPLLTFGGLKAYGLNGSIAEWMVFGGTLTESQGEAVDRYLDARRRGEDPVFPTADGLPAPIAHFRADEATVETVAGESTDARNVLSWRATNDPDLVLTTRRRPIYGIQLFPAEDGVPARLFFHGGYGGNRFLEGELPGVVGESSLTVCWLGNYAARHSNQTGYMIGELGLPFEGSDRDERVRKVGMNLAYSADGKLLVDSWGDGYDCSVTVRERATGVSVAHFEGKYWGVDFHPDSRRIACGAEDGSIHVFDVRTSELVAEVPAHNSRVLDVTFSPDGTRLASAGNDNALVLWDGETYERLLDLPGHRSYVRAVCWSPDGTMLVSGCADYAVRVWDATPRDERYAQVLELRALADEVRPEVEALRAAAADPADAAARVRERWADDPARRRAAMKELARQN